jgi:Uma2 family endonuclease
MSTAPTLLSAVDLLRLPDDGLRHELVNGELRTMTPSGSEHSVITARLARVVDGHVSSRGLGLVFGAEAGFRISTHPDTVRAPDLAFVRAERIPESGIPKGYWPGAPDLAAEVVSPGDTSGEVEEKVSAWLDAGTVIVWVLDPDGRTVAVHEAGAGVRILSDTDVLAGGSVLLGFSCPVADLFP